jgi:hypothetical protein
MPTKWYLQYRGKKGGGKVRNEYAHLTILKKKKYLGK